MCSKMFAISSPIALPRPLVQELSLRIAHDFETPGSLVFFHQPLKLIFTLSAGALLIKTCGHALQLPTEIG